MTVNTPTINDFVQRYSHINAKIPLIPFKSFAVGFEHTAYLFYTLRPASTNFSRLLKTLVSQDLLIQHHTYGT